MICVGRLHATLFDSWIQSVTWVVSVYTLVLLFVGRYFAITSPLQYENFMTTIVLAIASTWILSGLLWLFPLKDVGSFKFNDEEVACYFNVEKHPAQWLVYMVIIQPRQL